MSPEKHLAAILTAWNETDGYSIYPNLNKALQDAEADFDGVENNDQITIPELEVNDTQLIADQLMERFGEDIVDVWVHYWQEAAPGWDLNEKVKRFWQIQRERLDG